MTPPPTSLTAANSLYYGDSNVSTTCAPIAAAAALQPHAAAVAAANAMAAAARVTLADRANVPLAATAVAAMSSHNKPVTRPPSSPPPRRNPKRAVSKRHLSPNILRATGIDDDDEDYEEEEGDDDDDADVDENGQCVNTPPPAKAPRRRVPAHSSRLSVTSAASSPSPSPAVARTFHSEDQRLTFEQRRNKNNAAARESRARRTDRERENGERIRQLEAQVEHFRHLCQNMTTPAHYQQLVLQCNHVVRPVAAAETLITSHAL